MNLQPKMVIEFMILVADVIFMSAGKWALVVVSGRLLATCQDMLARHVPHTGLFWPFFESFYGVSFFFLMTCRKGT